MSDFTPAEKAHLLAERAHLRELVRRCHSDRASLKAHRQKLKDTINESVARIEDICRVLPEEES